MVTRSLSRFFVVILLCTFQIGFGIITPWELQYNQPTNNSDVQPFNPNINPFVPTNQPFITLSSPNPSFLNTQSNPYFIFTTPQENLFSPTNTGFITTMNIGSSTNANVNNGFILTTPSTTFTASPATAATFPNPTGTVTSSSISNNGSIINESNIKLRTNSFTTSNISSLIKIGQSTFSTKVKNDSDSRIIFPTEGTIFISKTQQNNPRIMSSTKPPITVSRSKASTASPIKNTIIGPPFEIESPLLIKIYISANSPKYTNGLSTDPNDYTPSETNNTKNATNSPINIPSLRFIPSLNPAQINTIENSSSPHNFIALVNASQPTTIIHIYTNITYPLITIEFHNSSNDTLKVQTTKLNVDNVQIPVQIEDLKPIANTNVNNISGNFDLSVPNWWVNFGQTSTTPISWTSPGPPNGIYEKKCQEYSNNTRRARSMLQVFIMGGADSTEKEFPHMAALGYGNELDKQWLCGGSLISDKYVLTAAHCLNARIIGDIQFVRLGTTTLQTETLHSEDYRILSKIAHPEYIPGMQYNDIALLELERRVKFTDYIAPICLTPETELTGTTLSAIGWGKSDESGTGSKVLRKVSLSYFPNNVCQEGYAIASKQELPQGILDNIQICAGSSTGFKDTCQGDSGGPLQITQNGKLYLVGITSFGIGCGRPGIPGVYTRVSYFLPWIESIVWGV